MKNQGYRPRYYNPAEGFVIEDDHVVRFFGCHIVRMLSGFPSINDCWSTGDSLRAVLVMKESVPLSAFQDMFRCLHFVGDWDDDDDVEWETIYIDPKHKGDPKKVSYRKKHGDMEDAFVERW